MRRPQTWFLYPIETTPQCFKTGLTPTLKHFNTFLSQNHRFKATIHVFSHLCSNRIIVDAQTNTIFAKALLKEHKYQEAATFLKTHVGNSVILHKNRVFDGLIQGLCTFDQDPERAFLLLKDFLEKDGVFWPCSRTFCLLICWFSRMGRMDRVVDVLELMSGDRFRYPFDNYVCSSVISGFVRVGEPELAVGFYETALKSGSLVPNIFTCTAVLSAYCSLRYMDKVSDLVSWIKNNELPFDVVFYSNWIYGCFGEGLADEAFKLYKEMEDEKVELDNISYTILIDGFSKAGYVEKAVGFLHKMRRAGVEPNLVTYTAIILGFCNKGKVDEAFVIFNMLKKLGIEADEFTYAILIHGVCRKGDFEVVFQLLDDMEKEGINPGIVTYNTVINGLCKVGRISEADDFSKGVDGDVVTYSTLLQGYVKEQSSSGILETKRRLESAGIRMDVVMCNIMIKAMFMIGLFDDALEIYKGLPKINLSANSVTYFTLIDGYCKVGRIDEALEMFDEFRKTSYLSAACYKCIILGVCEKGMVDMAIDVFVEYVKKGLPLDRTIYMMLIEATLSRKGAEGVLEMMYKMENVIGFPTLRMICKDAIFFLCKKGFPQASYSILSTMIRNGATPASMCYHSILIALLFEGKKTFAQLTLTSFVKLYGMSDRGVCETVVNYLCLHDVKKCLVFLSTLNEKKWIVTISTSIFKTLTNGGRVLDAYELLMGAENNLPDMNAINYSIMINALCKEKHIDKALDLCTLAKKKGVALNIVTYNTVINGLCRQGCLVEAFRLFDSLERINVLPTVVTYGTLIDALVREGLLQDARMLFERMGIKDLKPNTHIYNSLISGYCKSSLLEESLKLFQDLEARGLEPDGFTVGELINGYCQKGDMVGALKLYLEFKSNGLLPDFLGFMCLVRGLCAKGRMEESRSVLREMLRAPSVVDLLGRIDAEVESDSVENLLVFLCERGSINEAVRVLDEVGSLFFSAGRNSSIYSGNDLGTQSSDVDKDEDVMKICGSEDENANPFKDFESFYSLIHSHCLKGELAKANRLAKLLVEL